MLNIQINTVWEWKQVTLLTLPRATSCHFNIFVFIINCNRGYCQYCNKSRWKYLGQNFLSVLLCFLQIMTFSVWLYKSVNDFKIYENRNDKIDIAWFEICEILN